MERTIKVSNGTNEVLELKQQFEEVADKITKYFEKTYPNAEVINDKFIDSLSTAHEFLDSALLLSLNEEFVGSAFKRI